VIAYVNRDRCTGCGACVEACPAGAVRLVDGKADIDATMCRGCEACVDACPERAIATVSEPVAAESRLVPAEPTARTALTVPPVGGTRHVRPWLGAALVFVAREVVPRLATSLLDIWDRQRASTALIAPLPRDQTLAPRAPDRYLRQHRWRHGPR